MSLGISIDQIKNTTKKTTIFRISDLKEDHLPQILSDLKGLYSEIGKDRSANGVDKGTLSVINSIITMRLEFFAMTQKVVESIVKSDFNFSEQPGWNPSYYRQILKKLYDLNFIEKVIDGKPPCANGFRVVSTNVLTYFGLSEEERLVQFQELERFCSPKSKKDETNNNNLAYNHYTDSIPQPIYPSPAPQIAQPVKPLQEPANNTELGDAIALLQDVQQSSPSLFNDFEKEFLKNKTSKSKLTQKQIGVVKSMILKVEKAVEASENVTETKPIQSNKTENISEPSHYEPGMRDKEGKLVPAPASYYARAIEFPTGPANKELFKVDSEIDEDAILAQLADEVNEELNTYYGKNA